MTVLSNFQVSGVTVKWATWNVKPCVRALQRYHLPLWDVPRTRRDYNISPTMTVAWIGCAQVRKTRVSDFVL